MDLSTTEVPHKQSTERATVEGTNPSSESILDHFLRTHSGLIIALLCLYAGLRILTFAAAFPLFNSVDEQFHMAAIRMYAGGEWPDKNLPLFDLESARLVALYATPEYLNTQADLEKIHLAAPVYRLSPQDAAPYFAPAFRLWQHVPNFEAQAPPLYYLLGAAWCRLGQALGIRSWEMVYWIRLLNPAAYVLLVWVSYLLVRRIYPHRVFLWLGVPALLAVFPQDVYFGINRDVLSAPLVAVALLLMVKAIEPKERGSWLLIAASVLVGLAFLANISNCVVFLALAVTMWYWWRRSSKIPLTKAWIVIASAFSALALPLIWMLRNYAVMDDLTGSRAKIEFLGWTTKPVEELFDHPIFSLQGFFYFLQKLGQSFWRGEYLWHKQPMRWPAADWFYLISTAVLVVVFIVQSFRKQEGRTFTQRFAGIQSLLLVSTSVLFMAAISLPFDFHQCFYPSREHPFFVSGRIISGALLPFALIYVSGLEFLLAPIRKRVPPAAILACVMLFITVTEFQVRRVAFSSPNNFFSLIAWQHKH
jgi:hypothetical protein